MTDNDNDIPSERKVAALQELQSRIKRGKEAMQEAAMRFARGAFPDKHSFFGMHILLAAAYQMACESHREEEFIKLFCTITGGSIESIEPAAAPKATTH